jgi:subtilase family serine protease
MKVALECSQWRRSWRFGLLFLLFAWSARAAEHPLWRGHVPAAVATARAVGRLAPDTELELALGLPLRNRPDLTNLLAQIYDPASPGHRHFLTPAQFAERFGPTREDYATLAEFARRHGFRITGAHSNRTLLDVRAAVKNIESAFHVRMGLYEHPTEGRAFYAPDVEPTLDLEAPVAAISGLDNFVLPRPMSLRMAEPQDGPENTGSGPGGNFMGYDFRNAYVPGVTLTGAGQAVGLFEMDTYYTNDIAQYEALTGLPSVLVTNVVLDDLTNAPGPANVEVSLDIDMAIAMAPGLAQVIVYEGSVANDILNRMATDDLAAQLSSSWLYSPVNSSTEQIFQQFAAQGQAMFQASGDSGAYTNAIPPPLDNPWLTIVGGTILTTTNGGAWASETTWNRNSEGLGDHGSSGGSSITWAIPVWQQGINMEQNQGSATARNTPDVAIVAEAVWLIASNGLSFPVGGTSVGAPLWAGFMALANEQAGAQGQPAIGFACPALYQLARGPQYNTLFHDITNGNNTNLATATEFFATPGYDLCTGWGTPGGGNLINSLAGNPQFNLTVLNGGFETASFADWTVEATGLVQIVGAGSSYYRNYVHSGTYAAYLGQTGAPGYLWQTLRTSPGEPCLISFWLANPAGGGPSEFLVSWNGSVLWDQTNLPAFAWTNIQLIATAATTNTELRFGFFQDADAFGLDDVGVTPVPAPVVQQISESLGNFTITWTAWEGLEYQVQYTTELAAPVWSNLAPPVTATNGVMSCSDPLPADSQRFYRIIMLP